MNEPAIFIFHCFDQCIIKVLVLAYDFSTIFIQMKSRIRHVGITTLKPTVQTIFCESQAKLYLAIVFKIFLNS